MTNANQVGPVTFKNAVDLHAFLRKNGFTIPREGSDRWEKNARELNEALKGQWTVDGERRELVDFDPSRTTDMPLCFRDSDGEVWESVEELSYTSVEQCPPEREPERIRVSSGKQMRELALENGYGTEVLNLHESAERLNVVMPGQWFLYGEPVTVSWYDDDGSDVGMSFAGQIGWHDFSSSEIEYEADILIPQPVEEPGEIVAEPEELWTGNLGTAENRKAFAMSLGLEQLADQLLSPNEGEMDLRGRSLTYRGEVLVSPSIDWAGGDGAFVLSTGQPWRNGEEIEVVVTPEILDEGVYREYSEHRHIWQYLYHNIPKEQRERMFDNITTPYILRAFMEAFPDAVFLIAGEEIKLLGMRTNDAEEFFIKTTSGSIDITETPVTIAKRVRK